VPCGIGVSVCPDDGADMPTLLRNADAAMYHAKRQGKRQHQCFTAALNVVMNARLRRARDCSEPAGAAVQDRPAARAREGDAQNLPIIAVSWRVSMPRERVAISSW
jgi:hypothetical protein